MHVLGLDVGPGIDQYVNRGRSVVVRCQQKNAVDKDRATRNA